MTKQRVRSLLVLAVVMCWPALSFAASGGHEAAAAGHGEHHGFPWTHFMGSWINFAIFLGILWKFGLPPIQKYFAERREALLVNLNEAKRLREEAAAKLSEYEARLDALEGERTALLEEYRQQGERERERIIEDAKRQVEKLRSDAERVMEQEVKKASAMLEQRAVERAVALAEQMAAAELAAPAKQDALVGRYLDDIKGMGSLHGAA